MTPEVETARFDTQFITSLEQIDATQWNAVAGIDYPFLRHEFLWGLEQTGCTTAETGWQPCHLLLRQGARLVAIMPLYMKSHSYGEYVFDWSWADAWQQNGLNYYPKLVTAIPFTPAAGPRLCSAADVDARHCLSAAIEAVKALALHRNMSSWHVLFPEKDLSDSLVSAGLHRRVATQFHWFNDDYRSFDDFLGTFNSRKRKSLKRERKRVEEQGIVLKTLVGAVLPLLPVHLRQAQRSRRLSHARLFSPYSSRHGRTGGDGAGISGITTRSGRIVLSLQ
jgi:predicted N-acyltransferase